MNRKRPRLRMMNMSSMIQPADLSIGQPSNPPKPPRHQGVDDQQLEDSISLQRGHSIHYLAFRGDGSQLTHSQLIWALWSNPSVERYGWCLNMIWLVVLTCFNHLEKYESMGRIIPYMKWKIKNVPNHQPVIDCHVC